MPDAAPQPQTPPAVPPPVAAPPPAAPPPAAATPPAPPAPPPPAPPESILAPKPAEPPKPPDAPAKKPDAAPPPPLPELELKVPEGAKVTPEQLATFKAGAKELELNAKQAQALLERNIKAAADHEKAIDEKMQRDRVADLEKLKGDPKYGGAFYDQTRDAARSILAKTEYGPAVSKKLEMYGLDCDPDFVKLFAEFRSLVAEDTTSGRLTNAAPEVEKRPVTQTERTAATYKTNPVVK